jgi:hypothetical protein
MEWEVAVILLIKITLSKKLFKAMITIGFLAAQNNRTEQCARMRSIVQNSFLSIDSTFYISAMFWKSAHPSNVDGTRRRNSNIELRKFGSRNNERGDLPFLGFPSDFDAPAYRQRHSSLGPT